MDNLFTRFAAAAALTLAFACAGDSPDNRLIVCGIDDGLLPSDYGEADVYFVNEKGTLWSNGRIVETGLDYAASVFVSDGDVYVAGTRNEPIWPDARERRSVAAVWKNGTISPMGLDAVAEDDIHTSSCALSVFVSGGKVYAAGYKSNWVENTSVAVLWVDGVATHLSEARHEYGRHAMACSVYVSDGTVYVAGEDDKQAVLWVNGEARALGGGRAKSVCVSGGDVYVAGRFGNGPTLWKNGLAMTLGNRESCDVESVSVSGGNTYVAGFDGQYAILWVNGAARRLSNGRTNEWATAAVESGGNVYAVGYANVWRLKSRLWLDGKPIAIPSVGRVSSLFVAERTAGRQ